MCDLDMYSLKKLIITLIIYDFMVKYELVLLKVNSLMPIACKYFINCKGKSKKRKFDTVVEIDLGFIIYIYIYISLIGILVFLNLGTNLFCLHLLNF